jgi:hypothetical protein
VPTPPSLARGPGVPEEVRFIIAFSPRRRVERRRSRGMPPKSAASSSGVRRRHSHRSPSWFSVGGLINPASGVQLVHLGMVRILSLSSSARRASPTSSLAVTFGHGRTCPSAAAASAGTLATATFENDLVTLSTLRYVGVVVDVDPARVAAVPNSGGMPLCSRMGGLVCRHRWDIQPGGGRGRAVRTRNACYILANLASVNSTRRCRRDRA